MKDMIVAGTGDSRFLKSSVPAGTTWETALAQLRAGTFPVDFNGLHPGGITQQGSAYNKANVLPDDVCSLLGLNGTTAEPKDAFRVASGLVGDIKYTMRTTMGGNWALCNGDKVEASECPALCQVLQDTGSIWTENKYVNTGVGSTTYSINRFKKVIYANGYWVAVGSRYTGSSYQAIIAYTTDPSGEWTVKSVWGANYSTNELNGIAYANGYWVVCGQYATSSSSFNARIAYASTLGGTWTTKDLFSSSYSSTLDCVKYLGGRWVVAGMNRSNSTRSTAYLAYIASTSPAGTWSTTTPWTSNYTHMNEVFDVVYEAGTWVAAGYVATSSSGVAPCYAYSTDLATWTKIVMFDNYIGSYQTSGVKQIVYSDGEWIMCGGADHSSPSTRFGFIAKAASLDGEWTVSKYFFAERTASACITSLFYADGLWYAGWYAYFDHGEHKTGIMYATDINGTWIMREIFSVDATTHSQPGNFAPTIYSVAFAGNYFVAAGFHYSDTTGYSNVISYAQKTNGLFDGVLPIIDDPDAYAYIKLE